MADKRLQDIRTSDDAQSTVNVELIEWLKTSGVNYLLFVLVVVIIFRGYLWWGDRQDRIRDEAWADLEGTDSPAALEALADRAKGIDSVSEIALLRAARLYEMDILRDQTLDLASDATAMRDPNATDDSTDAGKPTPHMTEAERSQTLDRMERLYQRVLEMTRQPDSGTHWKELQHIHAMFGMAAVAEMRGDWDKAQEWFTRIESQASPDYEMLGKVASAWKNDPSVRTRIDFPEAMDIEKYLRELPPVPPLGSNGAGNPAGNPADKPVAEGETEADAPAGEDAEAPAEKPADQPADQPAEKPADEQPAEKPADGQPAEAQPAPGRGG